MPRTTELRRQVGQLLIMGFDGASLSPALRSMLRKIQPAGVILFARNLESSLQTYRLLRGCRSLVSSPLFTCVDMEGGTVDRFKKILAPTPSAAAVFASGKTQFFRRHGLLIGHACRALGFNTDFAPVLDLALPASQSVLASRAVSPDVGQTAIYASEFLRGLHQARVLGCGKHFPGLGAGSLDSHLEMPVIAKPWVKMWREDLAPYRALRHQLAFVMVAHANYPQVTGDLLPASLSSFWMREVLRRRIGFRSLIVSDDLEMGGVLASATIERAAIESIRGGADMFLVCHAAGSVERAYEAVVSEAESDSNFAQLVKHAAQRVEHFKQHCRELRRFPPAPTANTLRFIREKLQAFTQLLESSRQLADL